MANSPHTLGSDSIRSLLLRYAIPSIIGMTAMSLYNLMDSIFIGYGVGDKALAGLAVTFPFMNLAAAFGALVGVGAGKIHVTMDETVAWCRSSWGSATCARPSWPWATWCCST